MILRRVARIAVFTAFLTTGLAVGHSPDKDQSNPPSTPAKTSNAAPTRVRIASGIAAKNLLKMVNPEYPKELKKKRIQGPVTLTVVISKEGDVIEVKPTSGPAALAQYAAEAVKQWKFRPYLRNGEPVEVETQVYINFTLSGG